MPGKLTKNRKIREGQRVHAKKVLASVDEVLTEYDGSRSAKDRITRLSITLNEKLVTLKALDESILSAVEDGDIESEVEESENFRGKIHEALVKLQSCQVVHDQQENPQSQETHQQTKSNGNKSKLPKLTLNNFLQTAQVMVSRPGAQGTQSLNIRAIFDTGAERSYVSQRVVNALKLETIETEKLRIATFGDKKQELQAVNLVELALRKPFSVPHICSDLQGQDLSLVKENYPRLRDIEFADSCSDKGPMQIDLLIGSDYIWNFFDGKTIRGGGIRSGLSSGCLNNSWMGTVWSCWKPSQGKAVKHTVSVYSCAES